MYNVRVVGQFQPVGPLLSFVSFRPPPSVEDPEVSLSIILVHTHVHTTLTHGIIRTYNTVQYVQLCKLYVQY